MNCHRRAIFRLFVSLWAVLAGALICHAQSATCAVNLTDSAWNPDGPIQWLSKLDRIKPDRFLAITAVYNRDTKTRSIDWKVGRLQVEHLLPKTTASLCRDDDFGDHERELSGELWFGNTGKDVAQTTVHRGQYGPLEPTTQESARHASRAGCLSLCTQMQRAVCRCLRGTS